MVLTLRCPHCQAEVKVSEDDLDVDADVSELDEKSRTAVIEVTVRILCPRCGRRVLYYTGTLRVPIQVGKFTETV